MARRLKAKWPRSGDVKLKFILMESVQKLIFLGEDYNTAGSSGVQT